MEAFSEISLPSVVKILLVPLLVGSFWLFRSADKAAADLTVGHHREFNLLQRKYFYPYFIALFADLLQGPYVYKLYSYYGYAQDGIATLYITGFAASIIFGTTTGTLADRFGRKTMSIVFCVLYTMCCLTTLSPSFGVLIAGRVLSGISTSILYSVFESWYIYQHSVVTKFPMEWISITFSKATFFTGLLAIIAGVAADLGAEVLNFGPVAPFVIAIPFLLIAAFWIFKTWDENYGQLERSCGKSCLDGITTMICNPKILLLGMIQSIFESCIYIFVFLWTPVLEPGKPPLGLTFSSFMVAIMIGSSLYSRLLRRGVKSEKILTLCMAIMSGCMFFCAFLENPKWANTEIFIYIAFLVLETAVGLYFPAIGYARGETIPDGVRANIMTWSRVPLNILTCAGLIRLYRGQDEPKANQHIFLVCGCVSAVGLILSLLFTRMMKTSNESQSGKPILVT